MPFLPFASSVTLFVTSACSLLLSWMYMSSDRPWTIGDHDDHHHQISDMSHLMPHYQFSAMCMLLCGALLFAVVFLAPANRALTMTVHLLVTLWIAALGMVVMKGTQEQQHTSHGTEGGIPPLSPSHGLHTARLYYTLLALNTAGTVMYAAHLAHRHNNNRRKRENRMRSGEGGGGDDGGMVITSSSSSSSRDEEEEQQQQQH